MYDIILLIAYAIEPLMFIDVCNKFLLHEPEKKRRNSIWGFILMYSGIVLKQILLISGCTGQIMIVFLPLLIGTMYFTMKLYKERSNKKIIHVILAMLMLSLMCDGILMFILKLLHFNANVVFTVNEMNAIVAMLSRGLEALVYFCIVDFWIGRKKVNEIFLIFLYLVVMLLSLTVGSLFLGKEKDMTYFFLGVEITFTLSLAVYINYVIKQKTASEEKAVSEMELMKQNQMLTSQASGVRDELRSLRHDLRGHIDMMAEMLENEKYLDLKEYMNGMRKDINDANALCMSENMAISVVITKKLREAKEKGIQFDYALTTDDIPISLFEQNSLLNNLLSNAIEACMRENVHTKFIDFSIKKGMYGEILIKCSNSMGAAPIKRNGIFLTTKKDKERHGIGFKNIQKIVKNNHGVLKYWCSDEEDVFCIQITFEGGKDNGSTNMR